MPVWPRPSTTRSTVDIPLDKGREGVRSASSFFKLLDLYHLIDQAVAPLQADLIIQDIYRSRGVKVTRRGLEEDLSHRISRVGVGLPNISCVPELDEDPYI